MNNHISKQKKNKDIIPFDFFNEEIDALNSQMKIDIKDSIKLFSLLHFGE